MTTNEASKTVLLDLTPLSTPDRMRGIGRYVGNLAAGLQAIPKSERGGVRVLGLHRLGLDGSFEVSEDLSPRDFGPPVSRARWRAARRLWFGKVARKVGADLVHLGDPNATPLLSFTKRLVTCLDLIPIRFPEFHFTWKDGYGVVGRLVARRRYGSADHIVAISDATVRDLEQFLKIPPSRVSRIYCGNDLGLFSVPAASSDASVVERYGLSRRPFVIYVGDIDWRKNIEGMIGGLAAARAQGVDVALAVAGKLAESRSRRLDELALEHGVAPFVHKLGYVPDHDLVPLYRAALAHLFVSRFEGFGLTVVEAMAAGCPVVTTLGGSLGEVAGDAAILVDPDSLPEIGGAIARLAADAPMRAELVRRGRERAPMFGLEAPAREMLALYRKLLA